VRSGLVTGSVRRHSNELTNMTAEEVHDEVKDFKIEIHKEFGDFRSEMHKAFGDFKSEMRKEFADLIKTIWLTQLSTIGIILIGIGLLIHFKI
jgi:hypothetical protein